MRYIFLLTYRYLRYNKLRTALMVAAFSVTFFLPITVQLLIRHYNTSMIRRAVRTPLVAGAPGSRYELVLNTLYFRTEEPPSMKYGTIMKLKKKHRVSAIPVFNKFTAEQYPLVGTTPEYFSFRELSFQRGHRMRLLGDCVLGADVADALGKDVGEHITSDEMNIYDIGGAYPLKMNISGVLKPTGGPDDRTIFTDLQSTWVLEGIGHGHMDVASKTRRNKAVIKRSDQEVVVGSSINTYQRITPENIDSFHFHGSKREFPITGAIINPVDHRAKTMLLGEADSSKAFILHEPKQVIGDLMTIVFRIKTFFDTNFFMVLLSMILFLSVVILLSLRIRMNEFDTMRKIGSTGWTAVLLPVTEVFIILGMGLIVAILASFAVLYYAISAGALPGM